MIEARQLTSYQCFDTLQSQAHDTINDEIAALHPTNTVQELASLVHTAHGPTAHMGNITEEKEMSEIKVKTGKDQDARVVTVNYDIPETVTGLIEKYGEDQVVALTGRAITLAVQALVRQSLAAGQEGDLQAKVDAWVPGVRGPVSKKTPLQRAEQALATMSPEDLAALLAKVKAKQKGQ